MEAYSDKDLEDINIDILSNDEPRIDNELIAEINAFQRLGFRTVVGGKLPGAIETPYHAESLPGVALVANNDVSTNGGGKPPIEHGMLFLKSGEKGDSYLYTSLPADTPPEKIEELERDHGAFLTETPDGQLYGYIPLEGRTASDLTPNGAAPGDMPLNRAEQLELSLAKLELQTVPYPFNAAALRFLPPFINDQETQGRTADEWAEKIGEVFMASHEIIDMPDRQKDIAIQAALDMNGPEQQVDAPRVSAPRPGDDSMHMRRRA